MNTQTTTEEINERVQKKSNNSLMEGMVKQVMESQSVPHCDICGGLLVSGNIVWNNSKGEPVTICTRCIVRAVSYWMDARSKGIVK